MYTQHVVSTVTAPINTRGLAQDTAKVLNIQKKQDGKEKTLVDCERRTWRRSNPGKRYSMRGPLPSPAHAAREETMLF